MYYTNDFIDKLIPRVSTDHDMYANINAHNIAKMLKHDKRNYLLFGVYWWHVKDALRKYVDNGAWYCGKQDDPLMKERSSHGSEFRDILAAMYYMNREPTVYTNAHTWFDKQDNEHDYTLHDPDAEE
jgi:hypothetical protein